LALPDLAASYPLGCYVGEQGQQIFQVWWVAAAVGSPNPSKHRTSSSGSSKPNRTKSQPSLSGQQRARWLLASAAHRTNRCYKERSIPLSPLQRTATKNLLVLPGWRVVTGHELLIDSWNCAL